MAKSRKSKLNDLDAQINLETLQRMVESAEGVEYSQEKIMRLLKAGAAAESKNAAKRAQYSRAELKRGRELLKLHQEIESARQQGLKDNQAMVKAHDSMTKMLSEYGDILGRNTHEYKTAVEYNNRLKSKINEQVHLTQQILEHNFSSKEIETEINKLQKDRTVVLNEQLKSVDMMNAKRLKMEESLKKINGIRAGDEKRISDAVKKRHETELKLTALLAKEKYSERTRKKYEKDVAAAQADLDSLINSVGNSLTTKKAKEKLGTAVADVIAQVVISSGRTGEVATMTQNITTFRSHQATEDRLEKRFGGLFDVMDAYKGSRMGRAFGLGNFMDGMKDKLALDKTAGLGTLLKGGIGNVVGKIGPLAIIQGLVSAGKLLWKTMAGTDERVTRIAKGFVVSKDTARAFYDTVLSRNKNLLVSLDEQIEAYEKFNEAFGTSYAMSKDLVHRSVELTKNTKLSAGAMSEFQMGVYLSGQSATELRNTILGTSKNVQVMGKYLLNDRMIMDKVLSASTTLKLNFKGSYEQLAKAVTQATRLGTSLEQVDKFGESLLNWDQSIESELLAELLTNKELNLERARGFALTGDTAKLMDEMVKQVGTLAEFENMNVLQRRAFAQALGMSVDEMGDMLRKQTMLNRMFSAGSDKATKAWIKSHSEELAANKQFMTEYQNIIENTKNDYQERQRQLGNLVASNMNSMSVNEKFAAMMQKVQEKLATLFGEGQVLDKVADSLIRFLRFWNIIDENDAKLSSEVFAESQQKHDNELQRKYNRTKPGADRGKIALEYRGSKLIQSAYAEDKYQQSSAMNIFNSIKDPRMKYKFAERIDRLANGFNADGSMPGGGMYVGTLTRRNMSQDEMQGIANEITNVKDALINPSGHIRIQTPKGMIVPDKNDSIIATTDPDGLLSGGNSNIDSALAKFAATQQQMLTDWLMKVRSQLVIQVHSTRIDEASEMYSYSQ